MSTDPIQPHELMTSQKAVMQTSRGTENQGSGPSTATTEGSVKRLRRDGMIDSNQPESAKSSAPDNVSVGSNPKNRLCHICCAPLLKFRCIHYGGQSCYGCRAFFRRLHSNSREPPQLLCLQGRGATTLCDMGTAEKRRCQHCRYQLCLMAGMKPELVLSQDQKEVRFKNHIKKTKEFGRWEEQKKFSLRGVEESDNCVTIATASKEASQLSSQREMRDKCTHFATKAERAEKGEKATFMGKKEQQEGARFFERTEQQRRTGAQNRTVLSREQGNEMDPINKDKLLCSTKHQITGCNTYTGKDLYMTKQESAMGLAGQEETLPKKDQESSMKKLGTVVHKGGAVHYASQNKKEHPTRQDQNVFSPFHGQKCGSTNQEDSVIFTSQEGAPHASFNSAIPYQHRSLLQTLGDASTATIGASQARNANPSNQGINPQFKTPPCFMHRIPDHANVLEQHPDLTSGPERLILFNLLTKPQSHPATGKEIGAQPSPPIVASNQYQLPDHSGAKEEQSTGADSHGKDLWPVPNTHLSVQGIMNTYELANQKAFAEQPGLTERLVSIHQKRAKLTKKDLNLLLQVLRKKFLLFACYQHKFRMLTNDDQMQLLHLNMPLYIQLILGQYFSARNGTEQLNFLFGQQWKLQSHLESGREVAFMGYEAFTEQADFLQGNIGSLKSYVELCNHLRRINIPAHLTPLCTLFILNRVSPGQIFLDPQQVSRNQTEAVLMLKGLCYPEVREEELQEVLKIVDWMSFILQECHMHSVSYDIMQRSPLMPFTAEEDLWFQNQLRLFDAAHKSFFFGTDLIDEFFQFSCMGGTITSGFFRESIHLMMERIHKIYQQYEEFNHLSQSDQTLLYQRNRIKVQALNMAMMETRSNGFEQLSAILGEQDMVYWRRNYQSLAEAAGMRKLGMMDINKKDQLDMNTQLIQDFLHSVQSILELVHTVEDVKLLSLVCMFYAPYPVPGIQRLCSHLTTLWERKLQRDRLQVQGNLAGDGVRSESAIDVQTLLSNVEKLADVFLLMLM